MKIFIHASKEFIESCIEANDEVFKAIESEDQEAYWRAIAKQTVYGLALMNQLGTKENLGPIWEIELQNRGDLPQ